MDLRKLFLVFTLTQSYFLYPACVAGSFQQVSGSPFATGVEPAFIAFSPVVNGNLFAAIANESSNDVSVYLVNQITGSFTPITGSPFATGTTPVGVAFSPVINGNLFAAVTNLNSNNVSVYSVNLSTGLFTPVPGSPFATGTEPIGIAFSPIFNGNVFAAVTNLTSNNVSVYSVNPATGVFTPVAGSPFLTDLGPESVAFSPLVNGNLFAAVANAITNDVSVYSVSSSGVFTQISGSPFAAGGEPATVVFSPLVNGNLFAAVTNFSTNNVSVYLVNQTTGAFTPVSGSPFATGIAPAIVDFSPIINGNLFAAVTNSSDNNISVYLVNPTTGAFTPIAGSPFAAGTRPEGFAYSPLLPNGNLFAAANNLSSNNVSVYKVCIPSGNVTASTIKNIFLVQTELVNLIKWQAPAGFTPVTYKIYRDPALTQLAGQVTAPCTQFLEHNRQPGVTYSYFIVALDASGNQTFIGTATITS